MLKKSPTTCVQSTPVTNRTECRRKRLVRCAISSLLVASLLTAAYSGSFCLLRDGGSVAFLCSGEHDQYSIRHIQVYYFSANVRLNALLVDFYRPLICLDSKSDTIVLGQNSARPDLCSAYMRGIRRCYVVVPTGVEPSRLDALLLQD